MPFFSVVIPAYNRVSFLEETIGSVLRQDFEDFEIILIDDGSLDNTKIFIQEKYGENRKVKYRYKENGERGAARNLGIKLSSGEFIIFLDSDDFMHTHYLSTLYAYILKFPECNLFATKFNFKRNGKIRSHQELHSVKEDFYGIELVLKGNPLACNFCVKNDFKEVSFFVEDRDLSIMEDWLFLLQNLQKFRLYLIDKITLSMNDHDERSMRQNYLEVISRRLNALTWIGKHLALKERELKELRAHSYYFCSVHYFIGRDLKGAETFLIKAVRETGWNFNFFKHYVKLNLLRANLKLTKG